MERLFGVPRKQGEFEEYINEWIIINVRGISNSFGGYCVDIRDGYAVLNPFQGAKWDGEKGLTRKLIRKNSKVPLEGSSIQPTTKKDLENYCEYLNAQDSEAED